jgi:hypothetical protein
MMIRVCPKRDAECPHGMSCPYTIDRYECAEEPPMTEAPTPPASSEELIAEARERVTYLRKTYNLRDDSDTGADVDLFERLANALASPPPGGATGCGLCALGFAPFKAEGIMWHQVNGRDPFRCTAP